MDSIEAATTLNYVDPAFCVQATLLLNREKKIDFRAPNQDHIRALEADQTITAMQAKRMMRKGCDAY
ncbi:hypothetical protein M569_00099 [Genlisea aurea]|uniref:Uncharacterized protein n=1 Tax=Genlisea aurea TaxID=192259 RepID=S8EF67_9LAMI|nr:hypothetical protein M569_00099 [Genlisea aurea]